MQGYHQIADGTAPPPTLTRTLTHPHTHTLAPCTRIAPALAATTAKACTIRWT